MNRREKDAVGIVSGARSWIGLAGFVLALGLLGPAAASAAWAPDPMFSGDGFATADFGNPWDVARDVAVQPDGKVVAAGETSPAMFPGPAGPGDFAVARYNPDGTLDSSFDGDGLATVDFGGDDRGWAVAIQPDGKIVLAGQSVTGHDIALARLTPSGAPDPTFSGDGRVVTDLVLESWAYDVMVLPDGKILAGGSIFDATATGSNRIGFLVARYEPDGDLDPTFGSGARQAGSGVAVTNFDRDAYGQALALVRARPVLAGHVGGTADDVAVARYTASGAPDGDFSGDGKVTTDLGGSGEAANGVAVDGDEIVTAGTAADRAAFVRYRFDGSLATGFGVGGVRLDAALGNATDIAMQPDGKAVAPVFGSDVVRLNRDGTPDEEFGPGGVVDVATGTPTVPWAIAVDPSGRVVIAGDAESAGDKDFLVGRLAPPLIDEIPPALRLRVRDVQVLGRRIRIGPRCPLEACRIRATGILITRASPRRRFRVEKATADLAETDRVTLGLEVPRKGRRAAARALSADGTAKVRLKVRAKDEAGNRTVEHARVKLTR